MTGRPARRRQRKSSGSIFSACCGGGSSEKEGKGDTLIDDPARGKPKPGDRGRGGSHDREGPGRGDGGGAKPKPSDGDRNRPRDRERPGREDGRREEDGRGGAGADDGGDDARPSDGDRGGSRDGEGPGGRDGGDKEERGGGEGRGDGGDAGGGEPGGDDDRGGSRGDEGRGGGEEDRDGDPGGSHPDREGHGGSGDGGISIPSDKWWGDLPTETMGDRSYEEIKKECLANGTLYEDPDFPADISSLEQTSKYLYQIEWKRPKEIAGNPPVFIYGGREYTDIDQGILGNCWFVASVACICASPQKDLLRRVAPKDQGFDRSEYCGAFHFYFWQYGKWVEVIVDDRLPTVYGKLAYASNKERPNEYWCPLLEKAFAKLRGNYHTINGGRVFDGMVDLTGGIGELVPLKHEISTDRLEDVLIQSHKMNSCMGAAIFQKDVSTSREQRMPNGLYTGHAYSIINVKRARSSRYGEVILMHLRNPWSRGEWVGAWSDGSDEFETLTPDTMKATMKKKDDGEFWISVDDFRKNFDELELCHLTPDAFSGELARNLDRSQWKRTEYYGAWVKGKSAGGPLTSYQSRYFWSNPQFKLDLSHKTEGVSVVISLFEIPKGEGALKEDEKISIGFVIFKYVGSGRPVGRINRHNFYNYSFVEDSGLFWPYRERARQYFLEPAKYVVIPCTFVRGQEAKFYLKIFSEEEVVAEEAEPEPDEEPEPSRPSVENRSYESSEPPKPAESKALEEFNKKAGTGGVIDAYGLKDVLNKAIDNIEFSLGTCRSLAIYAHNKLELGMINKEQFEKLWEKIVMWRKAFRSLDSNNTGVLEPKELNKLFQILDFGPGADEVVDAIISKYGGKNKAVTEDDFLQSFAQVLNLIELYNTFKAKKQINMSHHEFIASGMLI